MPLINVKLIEGVFSSDQKQQIIERLTDAMVSIEGENMRQVTWCVVGMATWNTPLARLWPIMRPGRGRRPRGWVVGNFVSVCVAGGRTSQKSVHARARSAPPRGRRRRSAAVWHTMPPS